MIDEIMIKVTHTQLKKIKEILFNKDESRAKEYGIKVYLLNDKERCQTKDEESK